MPDVVAKAMAVVTGVLLVVVLGVLVVTSRPPAGTRHVVAEFRDAFPMLEGMQVRTGGAISGSIGKIGVDDRGLAEVTLLVDKAIPEPRADATATIRQADSTGDSYVAYDPGKASAPLQKIHGSPTIACNTVDPAKPCTNTLSAPRLDDLINAFGPPEQAGVKLILQNLSEALAQRGGDVNRAALKLVPALDAANHALAEVNTQNTALKKLIADLEAVSGQAASRRKQLARSIEAFETTLETTAGAAQSLDAGLQKLPSTEVQLQRTFATLTATAKATRPLAAELSAGAPQLRAALDKAPQFLSDVRAALKEGAPTLDLTRKLLVAGAPTIEADPQRVVTGSFDLAPALSNLLKGILGGDDTIRAFFGDDKYGKPENRPGFGFGFGAVSSEPGNQSGYPADWKDRHFVRIDTIFNCQTLGLTIGPNCLSNFLAREAAKQRSDAKPHRSRPQPAKRRLADRVTRPQSKTLRAPRAEVPAPKSTLNVLLDYLLRP
jgi:phospholipid/cholesterol/gamma-HCH transport system substrate-binding protein